MGYDDGQPSSRLTPFEVVWNLHLVDVARFQVFPVNSGYVLGWRGPHPTLAPAQLRRLEALRLRLAAAGRFEGTYALL